MPGGEGPHDPGRAADLEPALAELRTRLAADLEAMIGAVAELDQAQTDWRPAPDRWSVGEILHHLVLSNRAFARAVRALVTRGRREGAVAAEGARRSWPRLRGIADARVSGPVVHPDMATPAHGLPLDQLRGDLIASHRAVTDRLPDLAGLDFASLRLQHPLGFELNLYQWVDIAGAHERRHLAQVQALLAAPGFPRRT